MTYSDRFNQTAIPGPVIEIGPLDFSGPFKSHFEIKEQAGILATLVQVGENYELLSVYSTANLRTSALLELSYNRQDNLQVVVATYLCNNVDAEMSTAMAGLVWKAFS